MRRITRLRRQSDLPTTNPTALLVVVPDDLPADRRSLAAGYRAECGTRTPAVPCRRSVFERRKTSFGTLGYAAWHEGTRIMARETAG